ncbi:and metalloproteinase domain-containing 9-like [Podarcis lilfordi]|uniref:And metalloproteinase domain-containing 9-like n=1 Tax=Podarcis lilfordi TaxID=74358 RepID=A0AA35K9L8_9SAUR|nr:and metalloproteinase domain-containing 9-like [Podarcis lilfordi]
MFWWEMAEEKLLKALTWFSPQRLGIFCSEVVLEMLLLLLLLGPGFVQPTQRYIYSEVIVPKRLESRGSKTDISYIIKMEENDRVVHLKQRSFITANMPIYTYNVKGDRIADYPYIQTPEHLEPCRGIIEDGTYLGSEAGEIRIVDSDGPIPSAMELDDLEYDPPVRYLEYYAVVDKSTFILNHRNETQLVLIMLRMISDVHSIYLPLGLHLYLVGLELWTERDYITIDTENLGVTLVAFYQYAISELQPNVHFDHSGIITAKGFPAGLSWGDRFCLYTLVSVSAIHTYRNPKVDAETIAHVLGHSLGFGHDDTPLNKARGCDCNCTKPGRCIMAATGNPTCSRLSNCSRKVYYDAIRKPGKECLIDIPSNVISKKKCGNGVIEDDEECDCGHNEELEEAGILNIFLQPITKLSGAKIQSQFFRQWMQRSENQYLFADDPRSKVMSEEGESGIISSLMDSNFPEFQGPSECQRNGCCQKDCKLSPGIECLYGLCCERCKLLEEGTVCREAVSECDLPEYCNGSSPVCPPDVHKQDGMPCSNSNSCFMGNCIDLHKHCTSLFGQGAKQAPLSCFKKVNMRGDQAGNCGKDGLKYRKCYEEDVLCGRLQCTHVNKIPKMLTGQSVVQTPVEGMFCWGFERHIGQHVYDLGAVRDGTTCGTDKICMNRSCVDRAVLNYDCDFSKCSNRGVCNSKRNCHCSYGWAPPFCSGRGFGGSTDSGPPPSNVMATSLLAVTGTLAALLFLALGFVATLKRMQLGAWFARVIWKRIGSGDTGSQASLGSECSMSLKSRESDITTETRLCC